MGVMQKARFVILNLHLEWQDMVGALHTEAYRRFLKALIAFRKDRGISQAELASRLNRQPSWVAKNELGERRIDVVELAEIARAFEMEPGVFLDLLLVGGNDK